jgi:hypothetical protein
MLHMRASHSKQPGTQTLCASGMALAPAAPMLMLTMAGLTFGMFPAALPLCARLPCTIFARLLYWGVGRYPTMQEAIDPVEIQAQGGVAVTRQIHLPPGQYCKYAAEGQLPVLAEVFELQPLPVQTAAQRKPAMGVGSHRCAPLWLRSSVDRLRSCLTGTCSCPLRSCRPSPLVSASFWSQRCLASCNLRTSQMRRAPVEHALQHPATRRAAGGGGRAATVLCLLCGSGYVERVMLSQRVVGRVHSGACAAADSAWMCSFHASA